MEPWYDMTYSWLPGPIIGILGAILGVLAGTLSPRGIGRSWVLGLWIFGIVISSIALGAAVIAKLQSQPYHVWYGLGLSGLIGVLVFVPNYFVIRNRYTHMEMRKIDAATIKSPSP